jgi:hypothetical protein
MEERRRRRRKRRMVENVEKNMGIMSFLTSFRFVE